MSLISRMSRHVPLITLVSLAAAFFASSAGAQESTGSADSTLARQVRSAPISLGRGLSAAGTRGRPISAKYELEDGKPQLSVHTTKDARFWEGIGDHRTGRIAKAEGIKTGD